MVDQKKPQPQKEHTFGDRLLHPFRTLTEIFSIVTENLQQANEEPPPAPKGAPFSYPDRARIEHAFAQVKSIGAAEPATSEDHQAAPATPPRANAPATSTARPNAPARRP